MITLQDKIQFRLSPAFTFKRLEALIKDLEADIQEPLQNADYQALQEAIRKLEERGFHKATVVTGYSDKIILYGQEIIVTSYALNQFIKLQEATSKFLDQLRFKISEEQLPNFRNNYQEFFAALLLRVIEFCKNCWSWLRRQGIVANTFPTVEMSEAIKFMEFNTNSRIINNFHEFDEGSDYSNTNPTAVNQGKNSVYAEGNEVEFFSPKAPSSPTHLENSQFTSAKSEFIAI